MNQQTLDILLAQGEGQYIEYKERLDKSFAKEVCAFANASGGKVLLGVDDNSQIKGIKESNKLRSQIQNLAHNIQPSLIVNIETFENAIIVEVAEGDNKPYQCSDGFYMRMGANSQKMTRDEILKLSVKSGKVRFDEQICSNFDWDDFDERRFRYYLELANISNSLSIKQVLQNLNLLTNDGMTNAGVLLFASNPSKYILSSKLRCVHFKSDDRVDILDKKVIDDGIIANIEFAVEYIKKRVAVEYQIDSLKRKEIPDYPETAYRELVVNALIHNDYFLGDNIAVEIFDSFIVIDNKGQLLFDKEDFGFKSEARNRLIADVLARTSLMEKAGTGIRRVEKACADNGNKVIFSVGDSFRAKISVLKNEFDLPKSLPKGLPKSSSESSPESSPESSSESSPEKLPKNALKILKLLEKDSSLTLMQLEQKCGITKRAIQRHINKLKEEGKLRRVGPNKGGYWQVL